MIVVLADDFSGAAEVAGAAFEHGLSAEVHVGNLLPSAADVVVIDTDTRSCSAATAAAIVAYVCRSLINAQPKWIYKKTDSLLRGPVLTELNAICRELGMPRCLLVNANPRKGRCVRHGRMFIDGQPLDETQFANDPEHPRHTASLSELLDAADKVCPAAPTHDHPAASVVIGDADSPADVARWARDTDRETVVAGGAEFFEALLNQRCGTSACRARPLLELKRETLIVCGSAVTNTAAFSEWLTGEEGSAIIADGDMRSCVQRICNRLISTGIAVVASASGQPTAHDGNRPDPHRLHEQLIRTVKTSLSQHRPKHLWIEGGRTASGIIRACGWKRLSVHEVVGDGVIALQGDADYCPAIVVKPGSYAWPPISR